MGSSSSTLGSPGDLLLAMCSTHFLSYRARSVSRLEMVEGCWLSALAKASTSRSDRQSSSGKENWKGAAGVSEGVFPRSFDLTMPLNRLKEI